MMARHKHLPTARRRSIRALRCIATLGLVTLTLVLPARSNTTLAAWSDSEYGAAALTAMTVPPPQSTASCVLSPGLLGATPQITVHWRFSASGPSYVAPANVQYGYVTNGLLEPVLTNLLGYITTTPVSPGYTTVFGSGLLTGLLGGNMVAGIRTLDPSGWTSKWLIATASMGALGSNPVCVMSTQP